MWKEDWGVLCRALFDASLSKNWYQWNERKKLLCALVLERLLLGMLLRE